LEISTNSGDSLSGDQGDGEYPMSTCFKAFKKKKKTCKNGKDMRYVISQPLDYQIFQTPNTQSRFHQPIVS
jgi:hypothetical protein